MPIINKITESAFYKKNIHMFREALKRFMTSLFIFLIMLGVTYVIMSPVLRIVMNAIRHEADLSNSKVFLIPGQFTFQNFQLAFDFMRYPEILFFTMWFCLLITFFQLLICSLAGYGFARFRFPGRVLLFAGVVATIIIPVQVFLTPLYMQLRFFDVLGIIKLITGDTLNLHRTLWPVILTSATGMGIRSGLYVFIFRQFFRQLPKELEEAALIDGAGAARTFFTVMLPNASPALITVGLFSLVWQYNDTFFVNMFMSGNVFMSTMMVNLPGVIQNATFLQNGGWVGSPSNQFIYLIINAGVIIGMAPILITYFVLQRYFMEGIERSGIVG
ncbi:MAG: carbohydrate ABC transporter permease [Defluviitaleaceae bacterium]|nr:carbohydrate ABC transporter permease [Defluviitaleaceae bacterium]